MNFVEALDAYRDAVENRTRYERMGRHGDGLLEAAQRREADARGMLLAVASHPTWVKK